MVNQATALLIETGKAGGWHALKGRGGPREAITPLQDVPPDRGSADAATMDNDLGDAEQLELRIELGRTRLKLDDVQALRNGSVLLLDGLIDEPVSIFAGPRLISRGQIVLVARKIGVRVMEITDSVVS